MSDELIIKIEKCKSIQDLFDLWKEAHKNDVNFAENSNATHISAFVADGCPFPDEYDGKALFVSKEANHDNADENSSQVFAYRNFANGEEDWANNYMRTKYALMHNVIANESLPAREAVRKIAFMNINKRGGTSKTTDKKLLKYGKDYAHFIKRQIEIISPQYIICCGKLVDRIVVDAFPDGEWINTGNAAPYTKTEIWYYRVNGMIIVSMPHPSYIANRKYADLNSGTPCDKIKKYIAEFEARFDAIILSNKI